MKKQILMLIIGTASAIGSCTQSAEAQSTLGNVDKQFFIENKGQWPAEVLFVTHIKGMDAWITKNGVLCDFYTLEEVQPSATTKSPLPDKYEHSTYTRFGHRVWYKNQRNNSVVTAEGKEKKETYYNYFIGNDISKHASNVGLYKEATVKNVYNGIDVRYYLDKGSIRYDYVVHPGADPSQIAFSLEGADKTHLNNEGNLVFNTRFGQIALAELETYQGTKEDKISSRFVKKEYGWSITVGNYNPNQILIIDPLIYSTYLGGSSLDFCTSITLDPSGNTYLTGNTLSTNYDTTAGAYQTNTRGNEDIIVTKLNAAGSELVYSTYLGGSGVDQGFSVAIDDTGNVYVAGSTESNDYAITSGAYQTSYAGGWKDVFITKLNATGTALVYSTYLGGHLADFGISMSIDTSGNVYVTGYTNSTNFDITSGAYQTAFTGGAYEAFVTKLNASGNALIYSTFLGGSNVDHGISITVDVSGNAYVAGKTLSSDFDITTGAYQTSHAGNMDGFVTKLNPSGTALVYSTYLGGSDADFAKSIAIDTAGNAYVTGNTWSSDFYITSGAYQTSHAGNIDVYVVKLNASGTALIYSTFLGGSDIDQGNSIVIDSSGNAYVTGYTSSINYDITSGAYQTGYAGGSNDIFITKLNATGSTLLYSTYLGGTLAEYGMCIATETSGYIYITGHTISSDFDITPGAYKTTFSGLEDAFVTKICLTADPSISLSSAASTANQTVCINNAIANITYATTDATGASITGLPTGVTGSFAANAVTISGTPIVGGTFPYTVILSGGCATISATGSINVGCLGISNLANTRIIQLLPNPANTEVSIKGEFTVPVQLDIIDASGRRCQAVYSYDKNTIKLNVSVLKNGMYWVRIVDKGEVFQSKFVVQH